jgi:diguanylate cyclase (GGDEF)-like protein/PAS domain S-box-containing protein
MITSLGSYRKKQKGTGKIPNATNTICDTFDRQSLGGQLLRSHLKVVGASIIMSVIIVSSVFWVQYYSSQLAKINKPTISLVDQVEQGLFHSTSSLHSWVIFGQSNSKKERQKAWRQTIDNAISELEKLSPKWQSTKNRENLQTLKLKLRKLENDQWWVEDIANTPGNKPATSLYLRQLTPIYQSIKKATDSILQSPTEEIPDTAQNLLLRLSLFNNALRDSNSSLEGFLESGKLTKKSQVRIKLNEAQDIFGHALSDRSHLDDQYTNLLDLINSELRSYVSFSKQAVKMRQSKYWNVAYYRLENQVMPLHNELQVRLSDLSKEHSDSLISETKTMKQTTQISSAIAILLSIFIIYIAWTLSIKSAKKLTKPINKLSSAVKKIADGELKIQLDVIENNEIGVLTESFNSMSRALVSAIEKAESAKKHTQNIIDNMVDGVITIDEKGLITSFSPAAECIFQYSQSDVIGHNVTILMPADHAKHHQTYINNYLDTGTRKIIGIGREVEGVRKDGSRFPVELSISEASLDGHPTFTGIIRDISWRKTREDEIEHHKSHLEDLVKARTALINAQKVKIERLANHDLLTGLPTRRLFTDRLAQDSKKALREGKLLALLFIDLDGFKIINDTCGHDAGDYILKTIGSRITSCVRNIDTASRHGGDEFIIIINSLDKIEQVIPIVEELISVLAEPLKYQGKTLQVSSSIGISIFPNDSEDLQALINKADTAMYRVKAKGKNNYAFYS